MNSCWDDILMKIDLCNDEAWCHVNVFIQSFVRLPPYIKFITATKRIGAKMKAINVTEIDLLISLLYLMCFLMEKPGKMRCSNATMIKSVQKITSGTIFKRDNQRDVQDNFDNFIKLGTVSEIFETSFYYLDARERDICLINLGAPQFLVDKKEFITNADDYELKSVIARRGGHGGGHFIAYHIYEGEIARYDDMIAPIGNVKIIKGFTPAEIVETMIEFNDDVRNIESKPDINDDFFVPYILFFVKKTYLLSKKPIVYEIKPV